MRQLTFTHAGRFCPSLRSSCYALAYQQPASNLSRSSVVARRVLPSES